MYQYFQNILVRDKGDELGPSDANKPTFYLLSNIKYTWKLLGQFLNYEHTNPIQCKIIKH